MSIFHQAQATTILTLAGRSLVNASIGSLAICMVTVFAACSDPPAIECSHEWLRFSLPAGWHPADEVLVDGERTYVVIRLGEANTVSAANDSGESRSSTYLKLRSVEPDSIHSNQGVHPLPVGDGRVRVEKLIELTKAASNLNGSSEAMIRIVYYKLSCDAFANHITVQGYTDDFDEDTLRLAIGSILNTATVVRTR